jgi:hypothetical protein
MYRYGVVVEQPDTKHETKTKQPDYQKFTPMQPYRIPENFPNRNKQKTMNKADTRVRPFMFGQINIKGSQEEIETKCQNKQACHRIKQTFVVIIRIRLLK